MSKRDEAKALMKEVEAQVSQMLYEFLLNKPNPLQTFEFVCNESTQTDNPNTLTAHVQVPQYVLDTMSEEQLREFEKHLVRPEGIPECAQLTKDEDNGKWFWQWWTVNVGDKQC